LAFSVPPQTKSPPSLRNIFKEIERDPLLGRVSAAAKGGDPLMAWARQGVLLLNTVLTVEDGQPASHAGKGWEALTDEIVRAVAQKESPVVFMLWGKYAQSKIACIQSVQSAQKSKGKPHLILTANHPSPLSAARPPCPFVGCGHFSSANAFLIKNSAQAIDWKLGLRK
jgi:uracil-DNA glycosylase